MKPGDGIVGTLGSGRGCKSFPTALGERRVGKKKKKEKGRRLAVGRGRGNEVSMAST